MPVLVVFGSPVSPFVRKVEAVLRHSGQAYDFESINIMDMPDWFLEISPLRRIPVRRDKSIGETGIAGTLADSSAICLYLDRKYDAGLYGATAFDAGQAAWLEEYADSDLAMTVGMKVFRPIMFPRFAGQASDIETARKAWHEKLPRNFDYLERLLDGKDFFVNDTYSIADIAIGCQLTQLDLVVGLPDRQIWPGLAAHTENMKARPGFTENLAICGKMLGGLLPEKIDLS